MRRGAGASCYSPLTVGAISHWTWICTDVAGISTARLFLRLPPALCDVLRPLPPPPPPPPPPAPPSQPLPLRIASHVPARGETPDT
ncbi:hypothetical protein AGOR_G00173030 [Albula goreensis]|uniref:Uncharacterized protein n=1 Tax=Albula goreensis TaxID=1534307 RepID=A0A8T3CXN0_9TELE|nr:hypothetical protein AGOR_G00173030 [Albula goreensis]